MLKILKNAVRSETARMVQLKRIKEYSHQTLQTKYPKRILFSGIQPTGSVHLGNYFSAIQRWVELQNAGQEVLCSIADLHSVTWPQNPKRLRENTLLMVATLVACGVDFEKSVLFQQSKIPMHTNLCWILSGTIFTSYLEDTPLIKKKKEFMLSLPLSYYINPVLQAADILLYKATHIPVAEDQAYVDDNHISLAEELACEFNDTFGQTFPIPEVLVSGYLKSLCDPMRKMSKSHIDPESRLELLDKPDVLLRKIKKARIDITSEVTYEPEKRPGVANLINIHSLLTGKTPDEICKEAIELNTEQYKLLLADIIIEKLSPIREDIWRLMKEPAYLDKILKKGAERATELATNCWEEVTNKVSDTDPIQEDTDVTREIIYVSRDDTFDTDDTDDTAEYQINMDWPLL